MSNVIIQVENLGKKYLIGRDRSKPRYTALRDVIKDGVKSISKKLINPWQKTETLGNYTEFWALKDISFELKKGEVLGIIGNNGAGKSTLLKVLSRITEPTVGRVVLNGRVASLLEVGTGFHPELTGRENIYLNGSILGMGKQEIQRKFDEIVDFADVEKFLDTPVKQYSSGMYTRLAFAVAAHLEPEILVVDEVLAVGDANFQEKCLGKMEDVATKEGRTVLFVSHNLGMVNKLCGTCLYLDSGKVEGIGHTPSIIKQYFDRSKLAPSSLRIDNLEIKDLNIIEVSVRDISDYESPSFSFTRDFYLSVTYKVNQKIPDLYIYFTIFNEDGISVLLSCTTDYASLMDDGKPMTVGTYNSRVLVPGHLLFIGKYHVDVSMTIADMEVENLQRCLAFEITTEASVNYDWDKRPIIYPNLKWQTEKLD
jgi:lipopolysaccharide transport system ATP-binding protein